MFRASYDCSKATLSLSFTIVYHMALDQFSRHQRRTQAQFPSQHPTSDDARQRHCTAATAARTFDAQQLKHSGLWPETCTAANSANLDGGHCDGGAERAVGKPMCPGVVSINWYLKRYAIKEVYSY